MNYTLMRLLDKYIGSFLCLLISIPYLFKSRYNRPPTRPRRILITKFWGIGSIILASPTMKAIREKFPNAKITFLTLEQNRGLYEKSGLFDENLYFKLDKLFDVFLNFFKIVFKLRKKKFDLAIDLDVFAVFTILLLSLSNIKFKISHTVGKNLKKRLYDKTAVYNNQQHVSDSFFDLARLLGVENKPGLVKIPVSKFDKDYIDKILREKGVKKSDYVIGVNVNASDFGTARRWPYKNFAELADKIIQTYKIPIVFIGAKSDQELVKKTINFMKEKKAIDLSGKTNLHQLAGLLQRFNLLITNDSGPMHVAVALGTPVISFFGPETPLIYGPLGKEDTVFYKHLACSPCLNVYNAKRINCKKDAECIKSITVNEVISVLEKYLN